MKTNTDKAINYLQLYRMEHEVGYLFDAKRMINRELKERKAQLRAATLVKPICKYPTVL